MLKDSTGCSFKLYILMSIDYFQVKLAKPLEWRVGYKLDAVKLGRATKNFSALVVWFLSSKCS